jgi:two-component system, sensor histidine kinase and response regulator
MSEKSFTVLLIEDNPSDARLIRELLEEEAPRRFALEHATHLETGLDRLAQGGIDAALVDLSLPDSQGLDTFKQVYAHSPQVPIVVLTGLNDEAVAAQTLRAGGQDFLSKSLMNLSVLDQTIRHAMERKKAERLNVTNRAVESANRVHDHLLALLSYELKKPMTSLLSTVSSLTSELTKSADLLPTLAMIRLQAEMQGRLIEDILEFSQVGTRGAALQSIECEAVFQCALVKLKTSIDQTGAVVTHNPLPSLTADDTQIEQLFQHLIGNAIKFRGEKPPRIHVAARRQGEEWVFSIRDNGIGFDPIYAERIFTMFERLHDHDKYPGTGAGLAICRKIVERHNGQIWAESEPGRGSLFIFTIPARQDGEQ